MYGTRGPPLGWAGHRDSGWEEGGPWKKQRRENTRYEAILFKQISRLVREARDTVDSLTGSLGPAGWNNSGVKISEEESARTQAALRSEIQEERLQGAQSYVEWLKAAERLDELDGSEVWRTIESSEDYDVDDLKAKLAELESARDNEDLARMLRLIRHAMGRNVAGINEDKLFLRSRVGTKELVEHYVKTAVDTIESAMRLAKHCSKDVLDPSQINQDMVNARQGYGRTALLLSGGGTMGMMHIGVCKALFEADLLPRVISGTSAGSIVASVLGTRTDDEVPALLAGFCDGELRVFGKTPQDLGFMNRAWRFATKGSYLDIKHLEDGMEPYLGNMTFLEAYHRTSRILTIALSHAKSNWELPLLCCYSTTPHVIIRSAVAASCSIPIIYPSATLLEKDPVTGVIKEYGLSGQRFIDGSVAHDLPLDRLKEMLDVNYFIVSQVNPHIVPFLPAETTLYGLDTEKPVPTLLRSATNLAVGIAGSATNLVVSYAKKEIKQRYGQCQTGLMNSERPLKQDVGRMMYQVSSILEQKYTGDITIFPRIDKMDILKVLANPTPEFMRESMRRGEAATWPFLERIRARTAIERAIEKSVRCSLERVVFSPSQVNLRLDRLSQPSAAARLRGRRNSARHDDRPRSAASETLPGEPPALLFSRHHSTRSLHGRPSSSTFPSFANPNDTTNLPDLANSSTSPPLSDSEEWSAPSTSHFRTAMSMPTSPSLASKTFFASSAGPASPAAAHHPASLAMTPASPSKPSAPEQRYKTLFHPTVKSRNASRNGRGQSGAASPELVRDGGDDHGGGLEFALRPARGRRGSVAERKRSTSTGLKGLRPPGKQ